MPVMGQGPDRIPTPADIAQFTEGAAGHFDVSIMRWDDLMGLARDAMKDPELDQGLHHEMLCGMSRLFIKAAQSGVDCICCGKPATYPGAIASLAAAMQLPGERPVICSIICEGCTEAAGEQLPARVIQVLGKVWPGMTPLATGNA